MPYLTRYRDERKTIDSIAKNFDIGKTTAVLRKILLCKLEIEVYVLI